MTLAFSTVNMVLVSADAAQAVLLQRTQEAFCLLKHCMTATECLEIMANTASAIYLLDLRKPDDALFSLLQQLQQHPTTLGSVCMTQAGDLSTKLRALRLGADHVLTSPWEADELNALVDNLEQRALYRATHTNDKFVETSSLQLNTRFRVMRGNLSEQALSRSEFLLLMAFLQSDQQQLELWEIYEVLEKNEDQLPKQALEAQIYRLRKKMIDCGAGKQVLRANRLQGYQLCCAVKID